MEMRQEVSDQATFRRPREAVWLGTRTSVGENSQLVCELSWIWLSKVKGIEGDYGS
jgi:hypothetical protein